MTNLMQKVKPKPRFYLEPMRSLFNGGWLQEDDIKTNEFLALLTMHAEQIAEYARARKEILFEKKKCHKSQLKTDSTFEKQA